MKWANKKRGETGKDEVTASGNDGSAEQADGAGASEGSAESVESMLREFSSTRADAPAGATVRSGKYDQLWQLSMADPHTGLANRLLLLDRLSQALVRRKRHGGEVVVCHIGLDNLAELNLDRGYAIGNTVLCDVAGRLASVVRAEDTVARTGGAELVVVVTVNDEQAAGPLLRRLQHTLDEPVSAPGGDIRLRTSLGVAIAEATDSAEGVLTRSEASTRVIRR
jgi:diguanylate cyclase (GGDEF)-like protein